MQRKAVRFIKNLKGRRDFITENLKLLDMKLMSAIRQARRISLFHFIFEHEELSIYLLAVFSTVMVACENMTVYVLQNSRKDVRRNKKTRE